MIVRLLARPLVSIAAVLMLGTALSGCSSVPGWADPTSWIGGDSDSSDVASSDDADDEGLPADQQPDQAIDDSADTASSDSDQPDLAYIPDRPAASSTPQERQDVADSLAADRSRSRYSSETLRGDTSSPAPQYASATTPAAQAPAAAPGVTTAVAQQDQDEDGPAPAPTRVAMRSTAPQTTTSSTGPAVPANTGVVGAQGPMSTDAALGFEPSKAPPLDASVAQFVPQPIISRFQQTASADTAVSSSSAAPAVSSPGNMASDSDSAVGGPEAMTGAVVANLDAIQSAGPAVQASAYVNPQGMPPSQVVFFPHDTTVLNAEGRQLVRAAVEAYRSRGGAGFVRVVGHSSSRTANMSLARHLTFNFERSQARATAVAKELIRDGIPADKVLVEAVGDSQPVYYESMPQGEEGNRRAEIFL